MSNKNNIPIQMKQKKKKKNSLTFAFDPSGTDSEYQTKHVSAKRHIFDVQIVCLLDCAFALPHTQTQANVLTRVKNNSLLLRMPQRSGV